MLLKIKKMFLCCLTLISPVLNTKVLFKRRYGRSINLDNPVLFDEKIHWLKLNTYLNNKLVSQCADKYGVRDYVEKCGCGNILNELYGEWDTVEEIPWDSLPNSFVIKLNCGCHQNLICRDKSKLDIKGAIREIRGWFKERHLFYLSHAEMQYKNITPKLVCEKIIETENGDLPVDYKVYCFDGKPDCVLLCKGRDENGANAKFYFLDPKGNFLRYNKGDENYPDDFSVTLPKGFKQLFEYAEKLSKPFPFVRADFYLENGKITFGELTFTPAAGYDKDISLETQYILGEKLKLRK